MEGLPLNLTRDELADRFGAAGRQVELDYTLSGVEPNPDKGPAPDAFKKATIWEVWDKKKREVLRIAKAVAEAPLDRQPDPPWNCRVSFPCRRASER